MEALVSSITHLPEILIAVLSVLGGQKGYEVYRRKRYHSNGNDRRSGSYGINNSLAEKDKEFIAECFESQSKELTLTLKADRLELVNSLGDIIRREGDNTRTVVREGR